LRFVALPVALHTAPLLLLARLGWSDRGAPVQQQPPPLNKSTMKWWS